MSFASEYNGILETIANNQNIRDRMIDNIKAAKFSGKIFEGGNREEKIRSIFTKLFQLSLTEIQAKNEIETQLERLSSPYRGNSRVFSRDWVEKNFRTQLSRFYNQAVLESLKENHAKECYVHHSTTESSSKCIHVYAGKNHPVNELLTNLIASYNEGDWTDYKLPEHPNCSHVVHPL